jgi:hypothetical protein
MSGRIKITRVEESFIVFEGDVVTSDLIYAEVLLRNLTAMKGFHERQSLGMITVPRYRGASESTSSPLLKPSRSGMPSNPWY